MSLNSIHTFYRDEDIAERKRFLAYDYAEESGVFFMTVTRRMDAGVSRIMHDTRPAERTGKMSWGWKAESQEFSARMHGRCRPAERTCVMLNSENTRLGLFCR